MERYFINSTKYSFRERQTTRGKVYDVIFRIVDFKGNVKQKVLSGYANKAAAKRGYTEFVSKCCDPMPTSVNPVSQKITITEAYRQYIKVKSNELKESSVVSIENAFRRHILPAIGEKGINDVTKADAIRFVDELCAKTRPNGEFYSKKYLNTIKGFVNALYEWLSFRYDVKNPFSKVDIPKSTKTAVKAKLEFWERAEFDKFLSVVDDDLYRTFFAVLFYAGCRKSEAFALTLKDYDGDTLHINKTVTRKTTDGSLYKVTNNKNAKDYRVPVCAPLKKILDEYLSKGFGGGKFLFGGETPLAPTSVQRIFDRYIALAGVEKIKIHGLRHSFVSLCVHYGANYMVVADLICDTPEQVLRTYAHLWDSDKRAVIKLIN